jgi:hypothetical protein
MITNILSDFILQTANQQHEYVGIDSPKFCADQEHFKNYLHKIDYRYNSRGFRDAEWPDNLYDLQNAIWCVGDSFTVGLGSPIEHTWPWVLQQAIGTRTINVSMNGASNMWMNRRVDSILREICPKTIVIQWSFLHRRENIDQPWLSDEDRILHFANTSEQHDIDNTIQCIQNVESNKGLTQIIHSFIPAVCPPESRKNFLDQFAQLNLQSIGAVEQLDFARDKFHYDVETSKKIVDNLLTLI